MRLFVGCVIVLISAWSATLFDGALATDARTLLLSSRSSPTIEYRLVGLPSLPVGLSYSSAGHRMMFDASGKLTWAPNNIVLRSEDFSDANWIKTAITVSGPVAGPGGALNAWRLTPSSTTAYVYQSFVGLAGDSNFIWAVKLRSNTGSNISLRLAVNGAGVTPNPTQQLITITTEWQQFYVKFRTISSGGSLNVIINYTTAGLWPVDGVIDAADAHVEAVTYETEPRAYNKTTSAAYYGPRFDYDTRAHVAGSLLLETEARTNYVYNSENVTAGNNCTITHVDNGLFGGIALHTLTQTASNAQAYYAPGYALAVVAGDKATARIAFVAGSDTNAFILLQGSTSGQGLDADSSAYTESGPGTISRVGGATFQITGLTAVPTIVVAVRTYQAAESARLVIYKEKDLVGTAGETIKFGSAQFEKGAYPTSYIPTYGAAAVARAAETVTPTGAPLAILQSGKWAVAIEHKTITPVALNPIMLGIGANTYALGTFNDTLIQAYDVAGTPDSVVSGAGPAGSWTATGTRAIVSTNSNRKAAIKGGASIGSGGPFVSAIATPKLGSSNVGAFPSLGWYSSLAFWNSPVNDNDMQMKANRELGSRW